MDITLYTVPITTDASGAFTSDIKVEDGLFSQIRYVPHGSSPLDTGADLTISDAATGFNYYTHSNIGTSAFSRLPRRLIADSASGTESSTIYDYAMVRGTITVTIAQGGNTLQGTLYIWVSH